MITSGKTKRGEIALNDEDGSDVVLDAIGLLCPMPAVKTAIELEKMKQGEVLEVLTTDQISKIDLPAWCKETGNQLVDIQEDGEILKIRIRKNIS